VSDVARVRAIYCWVVNQRLPIIDDVNDIAAPETPFGYLYLIMHRKKSYADLFCKMCRYWMMILKMGCKLKDSVELVFLYKMV
jgi:hypothetical protein